MDLEHFLRLIVNTNIERDKHEKGQSKVDYKLVAERDNLIKLTLERGADPNKINYFRQLLPLETNKLLLENKNNSMNPIKFLSLILSCVESHNENNYSLTTKQNELIELVLEKISVPQKATAFSNLPTLTLNTNWPLDALMLSYRIMRFDVAWTLLQKGVADDKLMTKIFLARHETITPLILFIHNIATSYAHVDKELLKSEQPPETDIAGSPLMCYAAIKGDTEILTKLIDSGFNINIQDNQGNTPLMLAVLGGNVKTTRILLEHKADVGISNKANMNVLHMATHKYNTTRNKSYLELMGSLIADHGTNPNVIDNYFCSPIDHMLKEFLPTLFHELENTNCTNDTFESFVNTILENDHPKIKEAITFILNNTNNHIYDLVIEKLKNNSIQNLHAKNNNNARNIYIGIVSAEGFYDIEPFRMATGMMAKHSDVQVRIIITAMINDDFISQFDGLIIPGAIDNFPKNKKEFTIKDLNYNNMLPIEILYQSVISLADKYNIPTIGICSGNQHIILYHEGSLMPVDNYAEFDALNKHHGTFIKGSIPYFLTLTPNEQRNVLEKCNLPKASFDIVTDHHYAGTRNKLGENIELGALSEEGVVQSVYNGAHFISFQFHPENYYFDSSLCPNRNRLIWENFLEICRQHHRYSIYAKENNWDIKTTMKIKDEQNRKIIVRLKECAKQDLPSEVASNLITCDWFYQASKRHNLIYQEMLEDLLSKQHDPEEIAKAQECIQQQKLFLESSLFDHDETLPERKDLCDVKKFQWSDYDLLEDKLVNPSSNGTCLSP